MKTQNAGEAEGEDSRAGLSWGSKPPHIPSPGGAIQLTALQALKEYQGRSGPFFVEE